MTWIVGLALAAIAIYFAFFRKPAPHEVVIRVETSASPDTREVNRGDVESEENDNWEQFDFYRAKMLPAKGRYRIN